MARKKSAEKTAARGRPFARGDDPGRGVGKPGRSGRKSIVFVEKCSQLTDDVVLPEVEKYLRAAGPDDPAWRWCATFASEYSKSKPPVASRTVDAKERDVRPLPPLFILSDNGRGPPGFPPPEMRIEAPPSSRTPSRTRAAAPTPSPTTARPNGNGAPLPPGAYRSPDGRVRSTPPPE